MRLSQQSQLLLIPLACLGILIAAFFLLREPAQPPPPELPEIVIFCDADFRQALDGIVELYQRRSGSSVKITYGTAGELIEAMERAGNGDIFIPDNAETLRQAVNRGLIRSTTPFATMTPVLQVQRGNPQGIQSLVDLTATGTRLAVAEPQSATGRMTTAVLQANAIQPGTIRSQVVYDGIGPAEISQAVVLGQADVAINWKPMVMQYPLTEALVIADTGRHAAAVDAALLTTARDPTAAAEFIAFLKGSASQNILRRLQFDAPPDSQQ